MTMEPTKVSLTAQMQFVLEEWSSGKLIEELFERKGPQHRQYTRLGQLLVKTCLSHSRG